MEPKTLTRAQTQVGESSFLSRVYLWMSAGLLTSGAGALWLLSQPALFRAVFTNPLLFFGLIIAEIALVVWMSVSLLKMSVAQATGLFFLYSFLNGVTLSAIFAVYTGASVVSTFAITAGTFFFFSVYGLTTRRDLTSVGNLAMMGLIGLILASLVNYFLKSDAVYWITTYLGIAVFLGLIAYDTQKLKALYAMGFDDESVQRKAALLGALKLYLDFINLFLLLLRIFGNRRS